MKTNKTVWITVVALLYMTSCDLYMSHTVIGTGDLETMEVTVSDFNGVSVTGTCDVDIHVGEAQSLEVTAQSQILDIMTFEVVDEVLHIGFKNRYRIGRSKEISADIAIPSLSYVSVTGAGDFTLSGSSQEYLGIYITGTGDVHAYDLEVEECKVDISGAGRCELNVVNILDVQISGVGNILYQGNPSLISEISGVGNVTQVNN